MERLIAVVLFVLLFCTTCLGGMFHVDGAFNYESVQVSAWWRLDPNGGVGVMALTDSFVPDDTEENYYIGPVVEFKMDAVYKAAFGTLLPWVPVPEGVPLDFYGYGGLLFSTETGDMMGVLGTKALFFPKSIIHPMVSLEYRAPEASSGMSDDLQAMAGVSIELGKE